MTDARWSRLLRRPSLLGTLLATWFFAQSLAPSLLARSWLFQGVLTGVSVAMGYGIGLGLTRLAKHLRDRYGWGWPPFSRRRDQQVRVVVAVAVLAYAGWAIATAVPEHRWTWDRLGYERSSFWYVYGGTLLLAFVVAVVLFVIGRVLKLIWAGITRMGTRLLPAWIAGGIALVLVAWVALASINTFVLQRTLDGFNSGFALGDRPGLLRRTRVVRRDLLQARARLRARGGAQDARRVQAPVRQESLSRRALHAGAGPHQMQEDARSGLRRLDTQRCRDRAPSSRRCRRVPPDARAALEGRRQDGRSDTGRYAAFGWGQRHSDRARDADEPEAVPEQATVG